ncbi:PatB family C-S lyase [Arcobacteraceae bacterium]|nr:PatB family C-S lyase [Arcobacteraceae bacterium]
MYDFTTSSPREKTNAEKYTLRKKLFGTEDIMPVWVADMDIDTPSFVFEDIKKRLEHPILGYEEVPSSAYQSQINWMKNNHNVDFRLDDMIYSHSVVASINVAIEAYTNEGDNIIVQTPVYPPFFQSVKRHNREVLENQLIIKEDGKYEFDLEDLKSKINERTKMILLCSPHNPVGRVWTKEELFEILDICVKNNIVVFADEIHSDLIFEGNKHISFSSLNEKAKDICVTAMGVGKTFNLAGIAMSSIAISNPLLKEKFLKVYEKHHFAEGSVLSHVAFQSAYTNGKEWLDELKMHLYKNYEMLKTICDKYPTKLKLTPTEATYLAWIDCKEMNLSDKKLRDFFVKEAQLGLNPGLGFGTNGSGFMRLNFAVSQEKMKEVVTRLDKALARF